MSNTIPMQMYIKDNNPVIEYSIDEKKERNDIHEFLEAGRL